MRRVRTKSLPEFCVKLTPSSYARLMAIAEESRRPPDDLLATAVALFATAIAHVNLMHPPKLALKPMPKEQRSPIAPIGATVQRTVHKLTKGKPL
jgi:hypothetical protein